MTAKWLAFYKALLLTRLDQICLQLKANDLDKSDLMASQPSDEHDFALILSNSYTTDTLSSNLRQELKEIKLALAKISKNEYGLCENCDEQIAYERLKVKPHARFCIQCRKDMEK